ncbi:MAG: hypothetical protein ACOY3I_02160 [Verrucomicrobiota bacterium]
MSAYLRSIMVMGIVIPLMVSAVVAGACVMGYSYFHSNLKARLQIYKAIQQCRESLATAEGEAEMLDQSLARLRDAASMENFLSYVQTAASSEKGIIHFDVSENQSIRSLSIQGLSGPVIPILGDGLRKSPTIFTRSWSITKTEDGKNLSFNIVAMSPFAEQKKTDEEIK